MGKSAMKKYSIKIQHPEWLKYSHPQSSIDLFLKGWSPDSIAGFLMVTALKHPLRAIYGSDLKASLALLWSAIRAKTTEPLGLWWWQHISGREEYKAMHAEMNETLLKRIAEELKLNDRDN